MNRIYDWVWVEAQVGQTIDAWNDSSLVQTPPGQPYSTREQQRREEAYDRELDAVEQELRRTPRSKAELVSKQDRLVASFGRFSASALDLEDGAIQILTREFLPVGMKLAQWARSFDPSLPMADIIQACRNAWTACGLQPLLGVPVGITPSILGYSLLYPYSDNYLDREDVSSEAKVRFSERFRLLLQGEDLTGADDRETALRVLIELIEGQYSRECYPHVFDCLLAIHQAQEHSIRQQTGNPECDEEQILRVSCEKGGSSVVADACLAYGRLSEEESRFAFEWGVLLQLGDDLQDVQEDIRRGSVTLFSRAATRGKPLDRVAVRLLNFSEQVGARMDNLAHGSTNLKELLKMSWRSLILRAVADSHEFFSAEFVEEVERYSPFRFAFLRSRQERIARRQGLYAKLFEELLDRCDGEDEHEGPQLPRCSSRGSSGTDVPMAAVRRTKR